MIHIYDDDAPGTPPPKKPPAWWATVKFNRSEVRCNANQLYITMYNYI